MNIHCESCGLKLWSSDLFSSVFDKSTQEQRKDKEVLKLNVWDGDKYFCDSTCFDIYYKSIFGSTEAHNISNDAYQAAKVSVYKILTSSSNKDLDLCMRLDMLMRRVKMYKSPNDRGRVYDEEEMNLIRHTLEIY